MIYRAARHECSTDAAARPGYTQLASRGEMLRRLTVHGDTVVRERLFSAEETRAVNLDYIHHITERAARLAKRQPQVEDTLRAYIATQEGECDFIDREITRAIWLIQWA